MKLGYALVGNGNNANIRLNRAERIVGSFCACLSDSVE